MNAPPATTSVLDRLLRYVAVDTQSDEHATTSPSTAKQLVLLDQLVEELKAIGIRDAVRSEHGVVFATIPANSKKPNVPVIGLVAHVDTSPEASGAGVKPIVHRKWDGRDIVLPDDREVVLRTKDIPSLGERIGDDIVTASGDTLLGADDKAGVAEIMTAAEYLMTHREIPHGAIRIAFTPDEEIGRGVDHFDVKAFGARCAYTMDGEKRGRIDLETFSGDAMFVTFQGFNTHPGTAKGRMVNSIKVAGDFLARLPRDTMSPETTDEREGFVHPYVMDAGVDRTTVKLIVRDFVTAGLAEKERRIESLAREVAADWPGATATCRVEESYRNLGEVLAKHPEVAEHLREAVRRAGLTPVESAIRGGTDGSRLSFMGLPTPNVFTGGHNFHSRLEWVSVQDMEKAVEVIVELCKVWEERA
ncbi:MAG TPA: peptidase T [Dongiaceae bacterium]|nr:peptidase T [Dongiaceae bacterium]